MVLCVLKEHKASSEIFMLELFKGCTGMLLLFCVTCWVNFLHCSVWALWVGGEGTGLRFPCTEAFDFGSSVSYGHLGIRNVYSLLSKYSQKALSLSHRMSYVEFGTALLHLKVLKHLVCTFPLIHNYSFIFLNRCAINWNDNRI